jgi:hypothetical protein
MQTPKDYAKAHTEKCVRIDDPSANTEVRTTGCRCK